MTNPALSPRVECDIVAVVKPLVDAMRDNVRSNPDKFNFSGSGEITANSQVYGVTVSIAPHEELNTYAIMATFSCNSDPNRQVSFLEPGPREVLMDRLIELATSSDGARDGWTDTKARIYDDESGTIGLIVTAPVR